MTSPTQAQIDAAEHGIRCVLNAEDSMPNWGQIARAALTAAAQVGEGLGDEDARTIIIGLVPDGITADKLTPKAREEIRAAFETVLRLNAATQVGDEHQEQLRQFYERTTQELITATIERCVQWVAENYSTYGADLMRRAIATEKK